MNALALLLTLVAVSYTHRQVHDLSEEAFLSGGPARVVDTALTRMHADGRLAVGGPGIVAVRRGEARDAVERAVLQELAAAPNGALHTLRESVMRHPAVQEIGDGLAARGLLVPPGENRRRRTWALTLGIGCLLGFPVSIALTISEFVLHDGYTDTPFPFFVKVLPALLTGAVVGPVTAAAARARLTKAGRRAADDYRAAHAHLTDPAHLVATLGLRALPDPELQGQLAAAARQRPAGRRRPVSP
ncbi:TIGR04222 domain-containing membrane protein, partial [Streptomyces sp. NRRL S-15]|uniref:TIGR04222 domain-containing membrane protein n=1 Tax=Streptomyces sp. NRRL S-15 TaxID=1463886 RepID=UPI00068E7ADD